MAKITEEQYQTAKKAILKAIFIDHLTYDAVKRLIRDVYNLDYEEIAYRMDEEGFN